MSQNWDRRGRDWNRGNRGPGWNRGQGWNGPRPGYGPRRAYRHPGWRGPGYYGRPGYAGRYYYNDYNAAFAAGVFGLAAGAIIGGAAAIEQHQQLHRLLLAALPLVQSGDRHLYRL